MTDEDYTIDVKHEGANTVSFVGDSEDNVVRMYLVNTDGDPLDIISEVATFSPEAADVVMEQIAGAKHDLDGTGAPGPTAEKE